MNENENKNNVTTNVDLTIIEICKWLQNGLTRSELYPVDGIKALAELISARALMIKKSPYSIDSSESEDGISNE